MQINHQSFFFIGIKGVMMANLAVILKKMGYQVSGSDVEEEFITDKLLKENKINYEIGFSNLSENIDCVVYSAAHGGLNNPLIIEAKKRNIQVIAQTALLGDIMKDFKTSIAVTGCHGKTTTSSLLSYALLQLNTDSSYCVGVPYFGMTQGSDLQGKDYFVVEADEYGINPPQDKTPKFNFLNPDYIICTNIDFDHPDVYKNLEETKNAFFKFFNSTSIKRLIKASLILCKDDDNLNQLIGLLKKGTYITYGTDKKADYQIANIKTQEFGTEFELIKKSSHSEVVTFPRMTFISPLFGGKNVLNTTAVIVMLLRLGYKPNEIQKSLDNFQGAERRMQKIYEENSIHLFDDYAHHPNEIEASIDAIRQKYPDNRLIVIFQPHTFSRTKSLLHEFVHSLAKAEKTVLLPIFASARENNDRSVSSETIAKFSPEKIVFARDKVQSIELLKTIIKKNDVVMTMGAGDVYKLKDEIIKLIKNLK